MTTTAPQPPSPDDLDRTDAWAVLEAVGVGVTVHAPGGEMLHTNAVSRRLQAELEHGVRHSTVASVEWNAVRPDGTTFAPDQLPLEITRLTGVPVLNAIMGLPTVTGGRRWFSITTKRLRQSDLPCSVVVTFYDVTETIDPR